MKDSEDKIQKEIEAYICDNMSKIEKDSFENRMENDADLKEEVLLLKSLNSSFNKKTNAESDLKNVRFQEINTLLKSKTYKDISKNIKDVHLQYTEETQKKFTLKRRVFFLTSSVAAIFLIFFGIQFFNQNTHLKKYYNEYAHWEDLPSKIEKDHTNNTKPNIELLYHNNEYKKIIKTLSNNTTDSYDLIYLGTAYFHEKNYEKALTIFDELSISTSMDSSKGYWYKLLIYLHENQLDKSKEMLRIITKDQGNYNYKKALLLSKQLKYTVSSKSN